MFLGSGSMNEQMEECTFKQINVVSDMYLFYLYDPNLFGFPQVVHLCTRGWDVPILSWASVFKCE